MTLIDAHAHLWQRARTPQPWIDPEVMAVIDQDFWIDELSALHEAVGIDGAILVQSANSAQETLDLLALADAARGAGNANVRGVVGWVDLEGDVPGQLADLGRAPGGDHLVGLRHLAHEEPDPDWLARPGVDLTTLADRGLTFDLVVHARQLPAAIAAVAAHPRTRFVLDHLGNPPILGAGRAAWRSAIERLAQFDNVAVKLSGILPHRGTGDWTIDDLREPVHAVISLFGSDRVMFGSDWPLVDLAADAATWISIVRELVPTDEHEAVFSGTAERTYLEASHA